MLGGVDNFFDELRPYISDTDTYGYAIDNERTILRNLRILSLLFLLSASGSVLSQDLGQQNLQQWSWQQEQNRLGYEQQQRAEQEGQQQGPAGPAYRPAPVERTFETTYGAFAAAKDNKQFAFSVGRYHPSEAASEAKDLCQQQSGQSCEVVQTFVGACATLAWPIQFGRQSKNLSETTFSVALTSTESREKALKDCQGRHGTQCLVGYKACAVPTAKVDTGKDLWSAVAIDPSTLHIFPALRAGYNPASARAAAYDQCQRAEGTAGECQVLDHFSAGECRYIAQSVAKVPENELASVIRERRDQNVAKKQCEEAAGSACNIVWHGCT